MTPPMLKQNADRVIIDAASAIRSRMAIGAEKYDPSAWREESVRRHAYRAIKHLVTAMEINEGERPADGEDHLAAAVCRASMALSVRTNQPEGDELQASNVGKPNGGQS